MHVIVATLGGTFVRFDDVDPSSLVGVLKRRAAAELLRCNSEGFDSHGERGRASTATAMAATATQQLVLHGEVLCDAFCVGAAGITDGATLTIVKVAAALLAVGCLDGSVCILNAVTHEEEQRWRFGDAVMSVAWHRDGRRLAVASDFGAGGAGRVAVYSGDTGDPEGCIRPLAGPAQRIAWNPHGGEDLATADTDAVRIFVGGDDGAVRELSLSISGEEGAGPSSTAFITCTSWSPDGQKLAAGVGGFNRVGGGVTAVRSDSGDVLWHWHAPGAVHAVEWSPQGDYVAVASGDLRPMAGAVDLVLACSGTTERSWKLNCTARSVAWSPDATQIAASAGDIHTGRGSLHVFSADGGGEERQWHLSGLGLYVAWSPDGARLAVACDDCSLQVISVATGREECRWQFERAALSVAWQPPLCTVSGDSRRHEGLSLLRASQCRLSASQGKR
eukprot:gnl/TRDRNA2_/TRDRNA2_30138_c0_seq1.p1 gnl/TRDRNA2_/TRDRNA2_30138_c0~~gnl/TRDRNA2_/TRDRNA2_30138_c0_seq1.p1  ORF type:complete len:448 (+),score=77.45 gnl/TRDRNA2_/TRDRNA2_30138_c0_seq1:1-1344(+)